MLTKEMVRKIAPSVFAENHDGKRSSRYVFVSSEKIVDAFDDAGWGISSVQQPNVRRADKNHCKHTIRFRSKENALSFEDPRIKTYPGMENAIVYPEIIFNNSSNGTSRAKLLAGLFALVCHNGLTVSTFEMGEFSKKHQGFDAEDAYNAAAKLQREMPSIIDVISQMREYEMNENERFELAHCAKVLRWGTTSDLDPKKLLEPKREADMGKDLWTTFNVIQETTIGGGFRLNRRKARRLNNVDALDTVNSGLWEAASSYVLN